MRKIKSPLRRTEKQIQEIRKKGVEAWERERQQSADLKRLLKKAVWRRDRFICFYCGLNMKEDFERRQNGTNKYGDMRLTVDHIKPESRGGKWELENLVTSCRRCNLEKGDYYPPQTLEEYETNTRRAKEDALKRQVLQDMRLRRWRENRLASQSHIRRATGQRAVGNPSSQPSVPRTSQQPNSKREVKLDDAQSSEQPRAEAILQINGLYSLAKDIKRKIWRLFKISI